jgi:hypothetical protein
MLHLDAHLAFSGWCLHAFDACFIMIGQSGFSTWARNLACWSQLEVHVATRAAVLLSLHHPCLLQPRRARLVWLRTCDVWRWPWM